MADVASTADSQHRQPVVNEITLDHPWEWLGKGWKDLSSAPRFSLAYGAAFVVISYLLTFGLVYEQLFFIIPPLAAGFFLVAPLLGIGLYQISDSLERGREVKFCNATKAWKANEVHLSAMAVVLVLLAVASMLVGLIGLPGLWRHWLHVPAPFYDFLAPILGHGGPADHHMELILMLVSIALAFAGIALAWLLYLRYPQAPIRIRQRASIAYALLNHGYYFDNIYCRIVHTVDNLSEKLLAHRVEPIINAATLNQPSFWVQEASKTFARLQSGMVTAYVLYVFVGLVIFLCWGVTHV